jgi:hypothetical protein
MNPVYIINGKQRSVQGRDASPQLIHYTEQDGFCIHKKQYLDENGQNQQNSITAIPRAIKHCSSHINFRKMKTREKSVLPPRLHLTQGTEMYVN